MKIIDVVTLQLRIEKVEDVFDGTQDVLIVQVLTDAGITGFGEVVSSSSVARAIIEAPRSGAGRHGLRSIVTGMNPLDTRAVWREMYEGTSWYGRRGAAIHAMAGIDVALWDIIAKAEGQPLFRALGGSEVQRIRAYASVLWGDTVEETERLAADHRRRGFEAVKFGFGPIGTSFERDIQMVSAARRTLGADAELFVDVGRRWQVDQALERAAAFEAYDVGWVEEPLHPDDLAGYAALTQRATIPIAAAETEETVAQFKQFLDAGVKVVQPDLGRVGLTQALEISALARQYGARCVPHCFGSGINTTASIHWMAATGGELTEYPMRDNALCRKLVRGVPCLIDGHVSPGVGPGLGIELSPGIVERYAYA